MRSLAAGLPVPGCCKDSAPTTKLAGRCWPGWDGAAVAIAMLDADRRRRGRAALHRATLAGSATVASTLLLLLPMPLRRAPIALLLGPTEIAIHVAAMATRLTFSRSTNHAVFVSEHSVLGSDPSRRRCNLTALKLVRTEGWAHQSQQFTQSLHRATPDVPAQRQFIRIPGFVPVGRGCAGLRWRGVASRDSPPGSAKQCRRNGHPTWPRWTTFSWSPHNQEVAAERAFNIYRKRQRSRCDG